MVSASKKSLLIGYLETIVGPAAKLHLTVLIVEGEPSDVYLTSGHEDPWRDVGAKSFTRHHHVCWIRPVKCLACTENKSLTLKSKFYELKQ